jgi:hypothetical protein
MKIKQLIVLILIAAALGAAVWHMNKDSKETWSDTPAAAGGKVFVFPVDQVSHLTLHSTEGTVNLAHKGDAWTVQERADFPANHERVENLLKKLWDLKMVQEVRAGPSQYARFDLTDPTKDLGKATRVEFKDKEGRPLAALLVGKKFMKKSDGQTSPFGNAGDAGGFPAGRYVMPPGSTKVSLISDTLDDVDVKPASWLRRDFFKIEGPSSVTLAGATEAQKWKLTRENATADWKLDGATAAEKVDQPKASQVGSVFAYPAFADVLNPDAKPADTGLDKPLTVTITTFDGFTYVLKIGKENGDNQPLTVAVSAQFAKERTPAKDEKPEDKTKLDDEFKAKLKKLEDKLAAEKKFEGRPFLIAKSTFVPLLKDRATLIEEKKPEPAPNIPPQPTGGAPIVPGVPPPPHPPGAAMPPVPHPPVSVTTPPIAIPPMPPQPPQPPAKPAPVTATTPPVAVPAPEPPKPPAAPSAPATPQTPPPPAPPIPPSAPQPQPAK